MNTSWLRAGAVPIWYDQERGHAYNPDFPIARNDPGSDLRCHIGICLSRGLHQVWGRLLPQPMSIARAA